MLSHIEDGKVLDYYYKTNKANKCMYTFYVGDIFLGQIFNMGNVWSAVPGKPFSLSPINGFKTRIRCAEILIKIAQLNGTLKARIE